MKIISQYLSSDLKLAFQNADEIWVAVALMTYSGLNFIQQNIPDKCQQNYILGIDLPTDPKVLDSLYQNEFNGQVNISMFVEKSFYHPKVYIVRSETNYIAFVGSANCTKSGLESNIEMSIIINDKDECLELISWFNSLQDQTKNLTQSLIDIYKDAYKVKKKEKKEDEKLTKNIKNRIKIDAIAKMKSRAKLVTILKTYRNGNGYKVVKKERKQVINDTKKALNYPDFDKIDIESFFSIYELGHILPFPKPTIKREIDRFRKMLNFLIDESIDISDRFNETTKGNLTIRGVQDALISKVLTIHNPDLYYVKNGKSETTLKKFGLEFPKNISKGEQYKATCSFLIEICNETGIEDLAILDHYLYVLADE